MYRDEPRVASVPKLDSITTYGLTINLYHQWSRRGGRGGGTSAGTSYLNGSPHPAIVQ